MIRLIALLACLQIGNAAAAVTVTDALGRKVQLPEAAQRIVALAPHIVENVHSAGAGGKLVGVVEYSDYPAAAKALPRIGSYHAWSQESLTALAPDLVLMWASGNGMESLRKLEALGFTVYVSAPREIEDIGNMIRDIGVLAGTSSIANSTADTLDAGFHTLAQAHSHQRPVSAFYEVWNSPLQTINGEHMISKVIALCGGSNIFANASQLAPVVSREAVLQLNPEAILASGMDASRPEWLDDWRQYSFLQAVQEDALFHVHPDLVQRPTTRLLQGAEVICRQLTQVR
ncbi:cobalamin-binding protein [Halioglobus sp. HI00S01]|uniref:cobalamin-binding protein n=1 Tax=Halioglobus sp. HI00S01 TaxID=1822214 RepID=UPI0007C204D5|nr:cobalamin-binding protein [Halioglobus sp. HI00S01]KZX59009.1 cobalamin-binding protein [Halioglobus sp. HI00S01]